MPHDNAEKCEEKSKTGGILEEGRKGALRRPFS